MLAYASEVCAAHTSSCMLPYFTGARCFSIGADALDAQPLHGALDAQLLYAQPLPISSAKSEATRHMPQTATLLSSHSSRHPRFSKGCVKGTSSKGGCFGLDLAFVHGDSIVTMRERGERERGEREGREREERERP